MSGNIILKLNEDTFYKYHKTPEIGEWYYGKRCPGCGKYYVRSENNKFIEIDLCDGCILHQAWSNFIVQVAKALKIYKILDWLNEKLTKS